MKYLILPLLLTILFQTTTAFDETQTDWSGGDGVPGPANHWFDTFYTSDAIEYTDIQGNILLVIEPIASPEIFTLWQSNPYFISTADINGDGNWDIIGTYYQSSDILWFENTDGLGLTWTEHEIEDNFSGAKSTDEADIDGDGDMDVVSAAYNSNEICWFENVDGIGTSWDEHSVNDQSFDGALAVCIADINGDGYADIIGGAATLSDIKWWANNDGTGTSWTEYTVDLAFTGVRTVNSADFDGDGDLDILGAARNDNEVSWWENDDGAGTLWTEHTITDTFTEAICAFPCDIDGDGYTDVLAAAFTDNDIKWWSNTDGTGTNWQEHSIDGSFNGVWSVIAADIDGDGDADVIGGAVTGDEVTWWENEDGVGTSWNEHDIDDFDNAYSVSAADLNSSGCLDVICCSFLEDEIAWWEVCGYSETGSLESTILNIGMNQTDWGNISWNSETPDSTTIAFQVRSSDDPFSMGDWSDSLYTSGTPLSDYLDPFTRFFQYRVLLNSGLVTETPVLHEVTIEWLPYTDVHNLNTVVADYLVYPIFPNPVHGSFLLSFRIPCSSRVDITIYDILGRVVLNCADDVFSAGTHTVTVEELPCGIYICYFNAGEFNTTLQVLVL